MTEPIPQEAEHVLAGWTPYALDEHCETEHGLDPIGGDISHFGELVQWHVAAHRFRLVNQQEYVNSAEQELEWAHKILDLFAIPRTLHNPEGGETTLNVAGRIDIALNPRNEPDTVGKRPYVLREGEVPPWMEKSIGYHGDHGEPLYRLAPAEETV